MEKQGKLSLEPPFRYISLAIYFQVKAFKPSGNLVNVPFFDLTFTLLKMGQVSLAILHLKKIKLSFILTWSLLVNNIPNCGYPILLLTYSTTENMLN